jgi:hypothetical protein
MVANFTDSERKKQAPAGLDKKKVENNSTTGG